MRAPAQTLIEINADGAERRRFKRVNLDLNVRFMADGVEQPPAALSDISLGGAAIKAQRRPRIGERVIAYVEKLDRLEGEVVRFVKDGFAVNFSLNPRKQDRLIDALTVRLNEDRVEEKSDNRRFTRASGGVHANECRLADGQKISVRVVDFSVVGAAVISSARPPIGAPVVLGASRGHVVRHTANGFAVEFDSYWDGVRRGSAMPHIDGGS